MRKRWTPTCTVEQLLAFYLTRRYGGCARVHFVDPIEGTRFLCGKDGGNRTKQTAPFLPQYGHKLCPECVRIADEQTELRLYECDRCKAIKDERIHEPVVRGAARSSADGLPDVLCPQCEQSEAQAQDAAAGRMPEVDG